MNGLHSEVFPVSHPPMDFQARSIQHPSMKHTLLLLVALLTAATAQQPKSEQTNEAALKLMQSQKETDAKLQKEVQQLGATAQQLAKRMEKATAPVVAVVKKESDKAVQAAQAEIPAVTDTVVELKRAQTGLFVSLLSGVRRVADGMVKEEAK